MVDLKSSTPLDGVMPQKIGGVDLITVNPAFITSVSPYKGKDKALATALKALHDLALPGVGRSSQKGNLRLLWVGRGEYFLIGGKAASKTLAKSAALTDQSDGWVVMHLQGDGATDIMARLCPLDLRPSVFKTGHVARSEVAHVMAVVSKTSDGFEVMVMRSFARSAVHHIVDAMQSVAAQTAL